MNAFTRLIGTLCAAAALTPLLADAQTTDAKPQPGAPVAAINKITGAAPDARWEEEFAYTLGTQAYVQLFPWLYNSLLRWRWAEHGAPTLGKVPANSIVSQRNLTDASFREGGRPNNDTMYSTGYLDLSKEPIIITVPDMGTRYYTIQLINFDADNFGYIGTRATGNRAGAYALVGPNWNGQLPKSIKAVRRASTPWILIGGRVLVNGEKDLPEALKVQSQIKFMTLDQYLGKDKSVGLPARTVPPPFPRKDDPLADWKTLNRALAEIPASSVDAQIIKMFAQIGIGAGLDVTKTSPAIQKGLIRARDAGAMIVTSAPANNVGRKVVNNWGMTPPNWGRTGPDGEYLKRAAQSLGGIAVHWAEENIYPATFHDQNGERLSDERRYELRFEKNQIPPVDAFWSLTVYGPDYNLVANPINRFSVGDRSEHLKYGTDGSLTIYLQKDAPGGEKDSNWLPSGNGNFHMVLRAYLPKAEILEGRWAPPPVRRID